MTITIYQGQQITPEGYLASPSTDLREEELTEVKKKIKNLASEMNLAADRMEELNEQDSPDPASRYELDRKMEKLLSQMDEVLTTNGNYFGTEVKAILQHQTKKMRQMKKIHDLLYIGLSPSRR